MYRGNRVEHRHTSNQTDGRTREHASSARRSVADPWSRFNALSTDFSYYEKVRQSFKVAKHVVGSKCKCAPSAQKCARESNSAYVTVRVSSVSVHVPVGIGTNYV